MASSIIREGLPISRRANHEEIGNMGENMVASLLSKVYGDRKVSFSKQGYSDGTMGHPDMILLLNKPIAIEVKSMVPFVNYQTGKGLKSKRVNSIKINRHSWSMEKRFAKDKLMLNIVIVEVRLTGSNKGNLYFWIEGNVIDTFMEKSKGEWIHLTLWDILRCGNRLITYNDIKELELLSEHIDSNLNSQMKISELIA